MTDMPLSHSLLRGALSYAQDRSYQQLTLSLMQTLQGFGIKTDVTPLELTQADIVTLESFWRSYFPDPGQGDKPTTTTSRQLRSWALRVVAMVHSADLGPELAELASIECAHVVARIDKFLLAQTTHIKPATQKGQVVHWPIVPRPEPLPATTARKTMAETGKPFIVSSTPAPR